ncbi:MAG: hypothetical protein KC609_03860 [Myxococcales bacterium]|nr:hypothetical protein [Myxococcales bacterium]
MKKNKRHVPSTYEIWYADNIEGRALPIVGVILAILFVVAYFFGWLPERFAGLIIAAVVVLGGAGAAAIALLGKDPPKNLRNAAIAVVLVAGIVAAIPIFSTLVPGSPVARGELLAPGQSLELPKGLSGPIRIFLHGELQGTGPANARITFDIGSSRVIGKLSRTEQRFRTGRRGTGTSLQDHTSEYLSASVPPDAHTLALRDVHGALIGGVHVDVYSELVSFRTAVVLDAVFLLAVAFIAGKLGATGFAAGSVGVAMIFGLLIYRLATPDSVVRPEIGAFVIALVAGMLVGGLLTYLTRRFVGPRGQQTLSTAEAR